MPRRISLLFWLTYCLCCGGLLAQTALQFESLQKTDFPAVTAWTHVVGDFDGDRDLDIVTLYSNVNGKNLLLVNDGRGVFTVRDLGIGWDSFQDVASGDVDGDGDLDLVAATGATGSSKGRTRLFTNDGKGKFTDATAKVPVDSQWSTDVELADVDGDKDLDLLVANTAWNQVSRQNRLYLNDGKGTFTDGTSGRIPTSTTWTYAIAIGDIDGDRDLDIIFGNAFAGGAQENEVLLNDGRGRFTDRTRLVGRMLARPTRALRLQDIDGDGDLDLIEGTYGSWYEANVLYRNDPFLGSVMFTQLRGLPATPDQNEVIELADVDGDGDLDLFFGNADRDRLLLGNGRGAFTEVAPSKFDLGASWTMSASLADFDGDSHVDLFTADAFYGCKLSFGDGRGNFADATERLGPSFVVGSAETADLDGDGNLDVVQFNRAESQIHYGTGTGRFVRVPVAFDPSNDAAIADFDGDGDLDIAFANYKQRPTLYLQEGKRRFRDATSTAMPRQVHPALSIVAGDVDGDGDLDLVLGNEVTPNRLLLNDGKGRFSDATSRLPRDVDSTIDLVLVDVDGDKDLDLVTANGRVSSFASRFQNRLYTNDGKGKFTDVTSQQMPAILDFTFSVLAEDLDGDGDVDLVFTTATLLGQARTPNKVYVNDGKGKFSDASLRFLGRDFVPTAGAAFVDLDLDGDRDLVMSGFVLFGRTRFLMNDGKGKFVDEAARRIDVRAGGRLLARDFDGDGDVDLMLGSSLYVNRHRQVWSPTLAKLGSTWTVEHFVEPGYGAGAHAVLPLVSLGLKSAGLNIAPYGRLRLDPTNLIVLPTRIVRGRDVMRIALPQSAALMGRRVAVQSLVAHTASQSTWRLTNPHDDLLLR